MQPLQMRELELKKCRGECQKCPNSYYVPAIEKMLCTTTNMVNSEARAAILANHAASAAQYAPPTVDLPAYADREAKLLPKAEMTGEEYQAHLNTIAGAKMDNNLPPAPPEPELTQRVVAKVELPIYRDESAALTPETIRRQSGTPASRLTAA
jgi:hypothetical protein